ncbi:DNA polymerase [Paludifilum halophilum]|nr:DNA polymerase [Paludifilum halophilum]
MTAEERKQRIAAVQEKKKAAQETLEEAWVRIFSSKVTNKDRERLDEVKEAMDRGELERDPADMYTKKGALKKFSKAEALRLWRKLMDSQREQKLKELVENTPDSYRLITMAEEFGLFLSRMKQEPVIALDTETTGLDVYEDVIVGISVTLPNRGEHVYIPVDHTGPASDQNDNQKRVRIENQLERDYVLESLRPFLESEHVGKVLHNAVYDAHMFKRHGIELRGIMWDTQSAMHLLNENEPSYRLKDLATKYLGEPSDTFDTLFKGRFDTVPLDVALAYAAKDTDITYRMYQFQREHLGKLPRLLSYYEKIEVPLIEVVIEMERAGFVIDTDFASEFGEQLSKEIKEAEAELEKHLGPINLNSPAQLSEALFGKLKLHRKLPVREQKKPSTDKKTLKKLASEHPAPKLLLEYRDKVKLYGTYVETLPKQIKTDGRVHGSFLPASTVTGRFSSRSPNLQNQPKRARKLFVAPEGQLILGADFSAQEPRLLAHFTEEEDLIQAYEEGRDLYSYLASEVFRIPIEECGDGSKYRKMMKMGLLATMYGTGSKTLAEQLGISAQEAEDFIAEFYKKYPKVAAWIEGNKKECKERGYVEMLGGGRKRRLPEIWSRDEWQVYRAERQTTNAKIQGSAAIQTKIVMLALHKWAKQKRAEGRRFHILASIHDEVLLYVPRDITIEEVYAIEDIMVNTVKLKVPSATDIEISERWGESAKFDRVKGLWVCGFKKDGQELTLEHADAEYVLKRRQDGIKAGWEVM